MATKKKKSASLREKEIYNEAVRDTLKEVWLYDGIIPCEVARERLVRAVQEKVSYKHPNQNH